MTTRELLSRLKGFRVVHGGWQALCPAHDDRAPSLSISTGNGEILLHCHAGCEAPAIVGALGLAMGDLFMNLKADRNRADSRIVNVYDYRDEDGGLLFQVFRFDPKGFRQRRSVGKGGWVWHLDCEDNGRCKCNPKLPGARRVLFNLPAVAKAKSVIVCEGEKDCLTAKKLGLTATCNPGGGGKWRTEYSESLRRKHVVIICDADVPGLAHGREVGQSLIGVAASVRLIEALPQAKDLTDWVEKGGTRDKLLQIVKEAPTVMPANVEKWRFAKPPNGFTLTPLGELLKSPDVPVDYLWEGRLVAGTVSGVFAKPKVGKGTLARNLCLAVSRGEDFLGLKTKQGDCIYLALEEREEDVRNDFRAMDADGTEPILTHAAPAPAEGIRALCELVRERKPCLVVVDPLFRLAHVDEKAYAEMYSALGPLIDAARDTETHLMLLHHSGKSPKADPIDSPSERRP
jgi:putative DNA primase/helicase